MTRSTFHFRQVDRSPELQRIVEVLKQAVHPLSALEIMVRVKELYQKDALNISTGIGEISKNDGYKVLSIRPRRKTEQHRYALLSTPGWNTALYEAQQVTHEVHEEHEEQQPVDQVRSPRLCKLESCRTEITESGPPFCSQEHKEQFFGQVKACQEREA